MIEQRLLFPDAPIPPHTGAVYLIGEKGFDYAWKIGLNDTGDVEGRKKALETGNPRPLETIWTWSTSTPEDLENKIHTELAPWNVRNPGIYKHRKQDGEWFDLKRYVREKNWWKHEPFSFAHWLFARVQHLLVPYYCCPVIQAFGDGYTRPPKGSRIFPPTLWGKEALAQLTQICDQDGLIRGTPAFAPYPIDETDWHIPMALDSDGNEWILDIATGCWDCVGLRERFPHYEETVNWAEYNACPGYDLPPNQDDFAVLYERYILYMVLFILWRRREYEQQREAWQQEVECLKQLIAIRCDLTRNPDDPKQG